MRGSAIVMAQDLASTPNSGIQAQLCGDAHLLNFGAYVPERDLLFDLNDFDETLPGPLGGTCARLAASFVVAGRDNGFDAADCRNAARAVTASYRRRMAEFSQMGELEVWYSRVGEEEVKGLLTEARAVKKTTKKLSKNVRKARGRDSLQALSKLTRVVDGRRIIDDDPPLLVRIPEGTSAEFRSTPSWRATSAPCKKTVATCWRGTASWTRRGRSLGSAAWAPGYTSCCSKGATRMIPFSSRSRRPVPPCWNATSSQTPTSTMDTG